jgi:hypothetical protein
MERARAQVVEAYGRREAGRGALVVPPRGGEEAATGRALQEGAGATRPFVVVVAVLALRCAARIRWGQAPRPIGTRGSGRSVWQYSFEERGARFVRSCRGRAGRLGGGVVGLRPSKRGVVCVSAEGNGGISEGAGCMYVRDQVEWGLFGRNCCARASDSSSAAKRRGLGWTPPLPPPSRDEPAQTAATTAARTHTRDLVRHTQH